MNVPASAAERMMEWRGKKVMAMDAVSPRGEVAAPDELLHPAYWLVSGLDWPADGDMAEAAVVVAPGLIPREVLGHHAHQVLGCADLYASKHAQRVIFFSDLTRMFTTAGTSWAEIGVDWEGALQELHAGSFPALFLTISERAYLFICDSSTQLLIADTGGSVKAASPERELVRQAITRQLVADWPQCMRAIIEAERIRRAG